MSTHWPNPWDGDYMERRAQIPVFFHANSNIQSEGEATCQHCGLAILPGELVAEVDGDGMEYLHESCCGEDE